MQDGAAVKAAGALAFALGLLFSGAPAAAQGGDRPGEFDFYVLALSWSPTYCAEAGERADRTQCGGPRPFAFVLHGLWPQHERGFPRACATTERGPSRRLVESMLDVMPSPSLVRHQWRAHGTCSGLDAATYFQRARAARQLVATPPAYQALDRDLMISPDEVERAFMAANPGLEPGMIAVDCQRRRLREVRICLSKTLAFRPCPEVDRRACRSDRVVLPPVRNGTAP
jgi:ribonuclease T2